MVALRECDNNCKVQLFNPNGGRTSLQEWSLTIMYESFNSIRVEGTFLAGFCFGVHNLTWSLAKSFSCSC